MHFFHLARCPLPPLGIEAVRRDLRWRAVILGDRAYTDFYVGGDIAGATPFILAEPGQLPADGKLGFLVHLPDVLG